MKKKMLATMLAATMVMGMSMNVMAADHTDHGTADAANVGGTSEANTEKVPGDYDMETQFYINVDKDATSGEVEVPEEELVPGTGEVCHYELDYVTNRKSTISVTVPLYVCMYGYGGDGKIVTPAEDAYKMSNTSKYADTKELKSITPCYAVNPVTEEALKTVTGLEAAMNAAGANTSGQWGYYVLDKKINVVKLSQCANHPANKPGTCKTDYYFRGVAITKAGEKVKDGNGVEYTIGQVAGTGVETPLAVNVPTIKAENQTWKLVDGKNPSELKAGELVMSINGLDLSKAVGGLDITDLNWKVDAGADLDTAGTLNLPVKAAMAGNSVNEDGCVPVVRVTYTIAPAFQ